MADISYIQKGEARVNNQYRFASHDQVTAAIHPLLVKHGVVIIPSVKELNQDGNRTHVTLYCEFINQDVPTDRFWLLSHGFGVDASDKGPGKAVSYAYKYALLKVFALETGDDPDNEQTTKHESIEHKEFDNSIFRSLEPKFHNEMNEFLKECAESMSKTVTQVKKEAMMRLDDFMIAYNKWSEKK